jgi:hypothetical protein
MWLSIGQRMGMSTRMLKRAIRRALLRSDDETAGCFAVPVEVQVNAAVHMFLNS